ncbi:MAG TPA: hypothetical protein VMZ71_00190 [Gemmataceae bacterium]|nr:hypothetical protein [Gemmataceae bacterium]
MRRAFSLTILLAAAMLTHAQEPPSLAPGEIAPRFEVRAKPKTYPQANPKQALASLIAAADAGDHNYIVAHLMDPEFVDARIVLRARQIKEAVDSDLKKLRDVQRQNIGSVPKDARVPEDPAQFELVAAARARERAFPLLVGDVKEKLADDPQVLKDLRRFYREGTFDEGGRGTLPDLKDRAVFFKKVGDRWFMENRQTEAAAKEPEAKMKDPVEKKKDPDEKKP